MPLWGWQRPDKVDFEWPSQEIFDKMHSDVTLKKLVFRGGGGTVAGVRCILSNGISSPLIEVEGNFNKNTQGVSFTKIRPIRAVEASEVNKNDYG